MDNTTIELECVTQIDEDNSLLWLYDITRAEMTCHKNEPYFSVVLTRY